ncbi:MAG: hypothetical protein ACXVYY_01040 [Oryzihumus sp.]
MFWFVVIAVCAGFIAYHVHTQHQNQLRNCVDNGQMEDDTASMQDLVAACKLNPNVYP